MANFPLPDAIRMMVAPAVADSFDAVIESTGGAGHWSGSLAGAMLMWAEADAETRAKFLVRAGAKLAIERPEFGIRISEDDARLALELLGDVDAGANPHLMTDGALAVQRVIAVVIEARDGRKSSPGGSPHDVQ